MRRILFSLSALLLFSPLVASAQEFAYERDIVIPALSEQTSVWVPLDPQVVGSRGKGMSIATQAGEVVPFKELSVADNLLKEAILDSAPAAANTTPKTRIEDMLDGNPETAFQPVTAKELTFRFHFKTPVTPQFLVFQLSSGWIDHIRVRMGSSSTTLRDAFVGTPNGTNIELSGEEASMVEITVQTVEGVIRIAEAELLAPRAKLLFNAQPNEKYVLRYGTQQDVQMLPATNIFADTNTVTASLGPVRFIASQGPDEDSDSVPDSIDNCAGTANASQRDRDGDGIGDACDNAPSVPNSVQNDRDHDGIGDAQDNCPDLANPDQKDDNFNGIGWACDDADFDSVINSKDNCVGLANTDQRDLNHNNIGDACEDDQDHDGVPRTTDNCKQTSNPDQFDQDTDGIGDACDDCPYHYDPAQTDRDGNGIGDSCQREQEQAKRDSDGDGVPDAKDNCRDAGNALQTDTDKDGVGDTCDNCPSLQNADQADSNHDGSGNVCTDTDGDSVLDPYDNCIVFANADQADRNQNNIGDPCDDGDSDGIQNGRDNCPFDANSTQGDEDKDGTGNVCDKTDDRWSEQRPWLLYASMAGIIILLTGTGAVILKRSAKP